MEQRLFVLAQPFSDHAHLPFIKTFYQAQKAAGRFPRWP
jgi:hypothetical protein